jgi:hypothetical protein
MNKEVRRFFGNNTPDDMPYIDDSRSSFGPTVDWLAYKSLLSASLLDAAAYKLTSNTYRYLDRYCQHCSQLCIVHRTARLALGAYCVFSLISRLRTQYCQLKLGDAVDIAFKLMKKSASAPNLAKSASGKTIQSAASGLAASSRRAAGSSNSPNAVAQVSFYLPWHALTPQTS